VGAKGLTVPVGKEGDLQYVMSDPLLGFEPKLLFCCKYNSRTDYDM
jgi:hypothetical protein